MGDYVPTTDEVREAYVVGVDPEVTARYRAEFDRWLAEVERAAAARALIEAAGAIRKERPEMGMHILPTPYRDGKCHGIDLAETIVTARAAEIREGKSE